MGLFFELVSADLGRFEEASLRALSETYAGFLPGRDLVVDLQCVTMEEMRTLNHTYRSVDEPTDVLSFPTFASLKELEATPPDAPLLLGSIRICPEKVEAYGETLPQMIHHGLLHLLGYDHESNFPEWSAAEGAVLARLQSQDLVLPPVEAPQEDDPF